MINRVVLVGRLTRDIEVRKTSSGLSVTSFTVAVNRRSSNGNEADFVPCTAWRSTADFLGQYARKGAMVGVEGRISTRNYTDNSGRKVYVTEVVCDNVQLLESRSQAQARNSDYTNNTNNNYGNNSGSYNTKNNNDYGNSDSYSNQDDANDSFDDVPSLDISSDDLPF